MVRGEDVFKAGIIGLWKDICDLDLFLEDKNTWTDLFFSIWKPNELIFTFHVISTVTYNCLKFIFLLAEQFSLL